MSKRAALIDISKYDHAIDPKNVDGIIQRTSYHLTVDQRYSELSKNIARTPVRHAYHYYGLGTPWAKQVDLYLELTKNNPYTTYQNVWWDIEEDQWGNKICNQFINETAESLRYLQMEWPDAGGYSNFDMYIQLEAALGPEFLNKFPWWFADPQGDGKGGVVVIPPDAFIDGYGEPVWGVWRRGSGGKLYFKRILRPVGSWTFWQISFLGDPKRYGLLPNEDGETKKAVDENVYNGSVYDLYRKNGVSVFKYAEHQIRNHVLPQMK